MTHDSLYITFWKGKSIDIEIRSMTPRTKGQGRGFTTKAERELYRVVYLKCSDHMTIHICQNSKNFTLNRVNLLYVNYTSKKTDTPQTKGRSKETLKYIHKNG